MWSRRRPYLHDPRRSYPASRRVAGCNGPASLMRVFESRTLAELNTRNTSEPTRAVTQKDSAYVGSAYEPWDTEAVIEELERRIEEERNNYAHIHGTPEHDVNAKIGVAVEVAAYRQASQCFRSRDQGTYPSGNVSLGATSPVVFAKNRGQILLHGVDSNATPFSCSGFQPSSRPAGFSSCLRHVESHPLASAHAPAAHCATLALRHAALRHACAHTHARTRARTTDGERRDVRSAGVADWKTARGGDTERTLTA